MKIISLNTWGGRAGKEDLLEFFATWKDTADVFCLQEIWSAPYLHLEGADAGGIPVINENIMTQGLQQITTLLDNFNPYFHPHFGDNYGLLMLIKRDIGATNVSELYVYKEKGYLPTQGDIGNHARNIQFAEVTHKSKSITVINFHGLWNGKGKTDTEDRIIQSQKIVNFTKSLKTPVLITGDFNLTLKTKSVGIFEEAGFRNLIKDYGVTSTRTKHYTKTSEKFADYVFVSPGIQVLDFKILPDEVSDHAPMYVEVE